MRKLVTAAVTLVSALAFLVVGSPPASAFGSEVLGCSAGAGLWAANSCQSDGALGLGTAVHIYFSAHNTSGTYTTSWTLTTQAGGTITASCASTYWNTPCLASGCTSSSLSCEAVQRVGDKDKSTTAALTLTQSGRTRTITAVADIIGNGGCAKC
jgi:hypothetical protein